MTLEEGVVSQEEVAQPATEKIDKIVANRISEIRNKDRENLAKALGFESWDSAMNSGLDRKLTDAGIDPSVGKPIIDDIVAEHPEVVRARQILAEAEAAKKQAQLAELNAKYGLQIPDFASLDAETISLMEKGVPLVQAYTAIHYDQISAASRSTTVVPPSAGLTHVKPLPGNTATASASLSSISESDINNAKRYMPNASKDSIAKFLEKHPELK